MFCIFLLWLANITAYRITSIIDLVFLTLCCLIFTFTVPILSVRGILNTFKKVDETTGYNIRYNENILVIASNGIILLLKDIFSENPEQLKRLKEIISDL